MEGRIPADLVTFNDGKILKDETDRKIKKGLRVRSFFEDVQDRKSGYYSPHSKRETFRKNAILDQDSRRGRAH